MREPLSTRSEKGITVGFWFRAFLLFLRVGMFVWVFLSLKDSKASSSFTLYRDSLCFSSSS